MMAGIRSTHVFRETVDFDNGHWCNTCRLATGFRVWVAIWSPHGMFLHTMLVCTECQGHDVTVDPDVVIG